jgi:hypothetical protein
VLLQADTESMSWPAVGLCASGLSKGSACCARCQQKDSVLHVGSKLQRATYLAVPSPSSARAMKARFLALESRVRASREFSKKNFTTDTGCVELRVTLGQSTGLRSPDIADFRD